MPVAVVGDQGRWRRAVDREVARPVVLDQERPRRGDGGHHVGAPLRRERGAVRVRERRLDVDHAGAGAVQRGREQLGAYALAVGGDRHRAQARRACGREGASVGRRFDEHRVARDAQGAEDRAERRLTARADHDVVSGQAAAGRAGEPGAQLGQALDGQTVPGAGPPRGARERGAQRGDGLQPGLHVARREDDRPGSRERQELVEAARVERRARERHLLPGEIRRVGGASRGSDERPAPGPGLHDALRGQPGDRALDGHRRGAVGGHELPDRRKPAPRGERRGVRPHGGGDPRFGVIVKHGYSE